MFHSSEKTEVVCRLEAYHSFEDIILRSLFRMIVQSFDVEHVVDSNQCKQNF